MLLTLFLLAAVVSPVDSIVPAGKTPVSDAVYARRVYLDTWGLLPTPAQLAEFQADSRPNKRALLAETLLANTENYAGHWISFWNDHLRNDEGVVYHGERKYITAWLRKALEQNMPYNKFVYALLNPTAKDDPEGFIIGVNWRGEVNASELPPMQAAQNTAQVFLGVNLKCNSCHDSFISKWKLTDAYGMASFFSDKPLDIVRCDVHTGALSSPKYLFSNEKVIDPTAPLAERRAALARMITENDQDRLARTYVNRVWRRLFGHGIVEPVDNLDAKPWNAELLSQLAGGFRASNFDMKALLLRIYTSQAYQLPAVEPSLPFKFEGPLARHLTAEQFSDIAAAITGQWRLKTSGIRAQYVREWQVKSTSLTRSLGRPIRDQVTTERQDVPTTLQALELVNGAVLAEQLHLGAQRMLGSLPPPPENIYDSGIQGAAKPVNVDIDITGSEKLWLLSQDAESYDPARVKAAWGNVVLSGPNGQETLDHPFGPVPFEALLDIKGKGYTRLKATLSCDADSKASDINARVRYFVFNKQPDKRFLVNVTGQPPVQRFWQNLPPVQLVTELYLSLLGRKPLPAESAIALTIATEKGRTTTDGLEDLLWTILLSPEFQYVR